MADTGELIFLNQHRCAFSTTLAKLFPGRFADFGSNGGSDERCNSIFRVVLAACRESVSFRLLSY